MISYIAFLRGINISGKNKVPMGELKINCEEIGFAEVKTYLNSGNIAFSCNQDDKEIIAQQLERMIKNRFGLHIPVFVISKDELQDILCHAPDWWGNANKEVYDNLIFIMRAAAFALWMHAPNPMVTFFKTLDVTPLVRLSRKRNLKFNMLLCWCIGKAASEVKEFYLLPVGEKLMQYDQIAVNTIVMNKDDEVSSCDIPFSGEPAQFHRDYLRLTKQVTESCENHDLTDSMVIGTSAITNVEIDGGCRNVQWHFQQSLYDLGKISA